MVRGASRMGQDVRSTCHPEGHPWLLMSPTGYLHSGVCSHRGSVSGRHGALARAFHPRSTEGGRATRHPTSRALQLCRKDGRVTPDSLSTAVAKIRSSGAVAILGAGLSAARYPMTAQLLAVLWHALDHDLDGRAALAAELGSADGPAKSLIGDDPGAVDAAWRTLVRRPSARDAFQRAFSRLDADREPSPGHYALARLIHAGLVEYVVSFNWDTALERAHEHLYGISLTRRTDILAKPHGDADDPGSPWVLPHELGSVPRAVLERVAQMAEQRPRTLLVVGYSGSDPAVVAELLGPARSQWPVVHVSPDATGADAVAGTADEVLPDLADRLGAPIDVPGWRWVTFRRSRDLRAALLGYRLGPQDVAACPQLPGSRQAAELLAQTRFSVLEGDSGSGKSITAFQAAAKMNRAGWSVVELSQPGVATLETVRAFERLPGPVLAVVDDAQALDADVVHSFERSVDDDHAVLIVSTVRAPGAERIRVAGRQAVHALARYCEDNRTAVEPVLREVDDRVGYGWTQESFERRLQAAAGADYAWQFMFVLSGGERRIAETMAALVEDDSADLAFAVLAAGQLLSLDAGRTSDELAANLGPLGKDAAWLDRALDRLAAERLVVARDGRLRTPHLRIANRGAVHLIGDTNHAAGPALLEYTRSRLLDPTEPLQGRLWLLRALDGSDALRYGGKHGRLVDEQVAARLVEEALAAPAGEERNVAAYLIWVVSWYHALSRPLAEQAAAVLPRWIDEVSSDDVFGLTWLLGALRSRHADLHLEVGAAVAPSVLAERLAAHGSLRAGESWGRLLHELAPPVAVGTPVGEHPEDAEEADRWADAFARTLDHDRLASWVRDGADPSTLRDGAELAEDLSFTVPTAAAAVIVALTPALSARLESDAADASNALVPWAFSLFPLLTSQSEEFWQEHARTYGLLRQAVAALVDTTDWARAGRSLSQARLHELDQLDLLTSSLARFAPAAHNRLTAAVPLDALDETTRGHWADFSGITAVVHALSFGPAHEPARTWVRRHRAEIRWIPTILVPIAPDVAVEVVRRGGLVSLETQRGLRWQWCADALRAVAGVDADAARTVLHASRADVLQGFELAQTNMTEHLVDFVAAADVVDPSFVADLVAQAPPEAYEEHWRARLAGGDDERAAASLLVDRALRTTGPVRDMAAALRDGRAGGAVRGVES